MKFKLSVDGNLYLSEHFTLKEFQCKDGSDEVLVELSLLKVLEDVRNYFGEPVIITSAYRTPLHNSVVGGSKNSRHLTGEAVDFKVNNVPSNAVAAYLEQFYSASGIGLYNTFVHYDCRGYKVRWINKGNNTIDNFNLGNIYEKYKKKEAEIVTYDTFKAFLNQYLQEMEEKEPGEWSEEARDFVGISGIMKGDADGSMRWKSWMTREEIAQLIFNLSKEGN